MYIIPVVTRINQIDENEKFLSLFISANLLKFACHKSF